MPLKPCGVKNTCGGNVVISPPIKSQPPPRPPLGLLSEPRRAKVKGAINAHHEEMGGILQFPRTSRVPVTRDLRPLQVSAFGIEDEFLVEEGVVDLE